VIADLVFGQQDEVIGAFIGWGSAGAMLWRHIDLGAENGLYPGFLSLEIEVEDPIESAMVSDSQGIHAQLLSPGDQMGNAAHAIEEAVFSVDVEMGKHRS